MVCKDQNYAQKKIVLVLEKLWKRTKLLSKSYQCMGERSLKRDIELIDYARGIDIDTITEHCAPQSFTSNATRGFRRHKLDDIIQFMTAETSSCI